MTNSKINTNDQLNNIRGVISNLQIFKNNKAVLSTNLCNNSKTNKIYII